MANFFCVAFSLLLFFSGSANALVPKSVIYSATPGHCAPAPTFTGTSVASVCAQILGWYQGPCDAINSGASGVESQQDPPLCHITQNNGGPGVNFSLSVSGGACPEGSVASGSECAYDSSHTEINGECQPKNSDKEACDNWAAINRIPGGALVQDYRLQGNIAHGSEYCMSGANTSAGKGCKVQFEKEMAANYGTEAAPNWVTEGTFNTHDTATSDQSCVLGDGTSPPKVPAPEKCKNGYTGVVNGVEVCINKVPDSGVGGDKEEDTTETETEKKTVKKDSNTECKNGTCTTTTTTTTTTTKKPGGEVTTSSTTSTSTQSQAGFCEANKSSKLCGGGDGDGSAFSGSCAAGFKCEGDAIQCAISQEQHRRACNLFDDVTPESQLYDAEKGKTGKRTGDLPGNETVAFGSSMYDASNALGPGTCISDLPVDVLGQTVSLPISQICPHLATLRLALLAFGAFLWVLIVFRG